MPEESTVEVYFSRIIFLSILLFMNICGYLFCFFCLICSKDNTTILFYLQKKKEKQKQNKISKPAELLSDKQMSMYSYENKLKNVLCLLIQSFLKYYFQGTFYYIPRIQLQKSTRSSISTSRNGIPVGWIIQKIDTPIEEDKLYPQ